ncbi:MAG TPA: hypothetical protein VIW22_03240, partial [Nitrososphaerales archaeon]
MDIGRQYTCELCGKSFQSNRKLFGHKAGAHRNHAGVRASHIHVYGLSDTQKGYIAAFLDGEGGIQITRTTRKDREYKIALHPSVYFTNTNMEVIFAIRKWLGGGSVTRRRGNFRHRDTYVLTISGVRSILELLQSVRPLLIVKAKRADLMI